MRTVHPQNFGADTGTGEPIGLCFAGQLMRTGTGQKHLKTWYMAEKKDVCVYHHEQQESR